MIRFSAIRNATAVLIIGSTRSDRVNPGHLYPLLAGILVLLTIGCGPESTPETILAPNTATSPRPALAAGKGDPSGTVTVEIQEGTVARYLVREQLARLDFPNDAVGETSDVVGRIIFDPVGDIDSAASKITVDLRTLKSDKSRRDRFLRTRSLESDVFPTAEFVVKELPGLGWPLLKEG